MTSPLHWRVMATHVPAGGQLGGVVRYTIELLRALAERDDVVVSALTTRDSVDTIREIIGADAQVAAVRGAPVPLLSVLERRAPLSSLRRGIDVVQGTKHLVPHRSPALRVLTVHDLLLLDRPQDFGAAKRLLLPGPYRASIADADLLVCVSAATRTRLEAQVPGSATKAAVVHLATSGSLRTALPRSLPALIGRRFALVVGDPTPRKNLRTVMAAWPAVRAEHPDAVLAVAGPPSWGRTDVGGLYDQLVTDGAVVPLGHVDDAELRWAYEHAAVVLCPSLAEGFGLPAAEALDLGARLIISDDAALQEVAAGRAEAVLPPVDVAAWSAAVNRVLAAAPGGVAVDAPRTWADVAAETVQAARAALARRTGTWPETQHS